MNEKNKNNRITGAAIAEQLGISQATVSRALAGNKRISQNVREQVREAARQLGYVSNAAARTLVKGRSNVIGILSGGLHVERTAMELIALDAELRKHGLLPYLYYTRSESDRIVEGARHLIEQGVDGLLIIGTSPGAVNELKYHSLHCMLPTVFVDSPLAGHRVNMVTNNYLEAYREAAEVMRQAGHCQVCGILRTSYDLKSIDIQDTRYQGVKLLLAACGRENCMLVVPSPRPSVLADTREANEKTVAEVCRLLDEHPECDALVCHDDDLALCATSILLQRGKKIPQEVMVLGFGNAQLGELMQPQLSTIAQQPLVLAEKTVARLLELIDNPSEEIKAISIPGKFIRRKTF